MLHARLFGGSAKVRDEYFRPTRSSLVSKEKSSSPAWLDGNPEIDRPLFAQFCANKPEELLNAAQYVAPYCDAVDLNLGCPQGIAKAGHYGAFLQEDWDSIFKMINTLHKELAVPITAKMRILDTREKTLQYAKMILSAGASILTVHGRRREQKGHNAGVADWSMIRYLRDNLPPETVLFANGNILNSGDLQACLDATGADGIMSAEGNLSDPTIFAAPAEHHDPREYWRGADGKGGYRLDAVFRRYLDIIYTYSLNRPPPERAPLYIPGDSASVVTLPDEPLVDEDQALNSKKRKRVTRPKADPNLKAMQGHLFSLLKPMMSIHTDVRDTLARARCGEIEGFESVLTMVENRIAKALEDEAAADSHEGSQVTSETAQDEQPLTPRQKTQAKYKRPWWICQPFIRPMPEEAVKVGALQPRKKEKARLATLEAAETKQDTIGRTDDPGDGQSELKSSLTQGPEAALVCG